MHLLKQNQNKRRRQSTATRAQVVRTFHEMCSWRRRRLLRHMCSAALSDRYHSWPANKMWRKLLYSRFETCFGPSTQGAGTKTHLKSRVHAILTKRGAVIECGIGRPSRKCRYGRLSPKSRETGLHCRLCSKTRLCMRDACHIPRQRLFVGGMSVGKARGVFGAQ